MGTRNVIRFGVITTLVMIPVVSLSFASAGSSPAVTEAHEYATWLRQAIAEGQHYLSYGRSTILDIQDTMTRPADVLEARYSENPRGVFRMNDGSQVVFVLRTDDRGEARLADIRARRK